MSDKLDAPHPDHAEHIQWEGSDRVVIRPEEYEELYRAAMLVASHPTPALPADWQPIESAPKHQEVLVWREDAGIFIAKFTEPQCVMSEREVEECDFPDGFEEWWTDGHGWLEGQERPTKWKPMPKGPSA